MTTDDEEEPGVPDSPLDDLFVEGARYREPSAAERAEWAKQQRKELDEAKKKRQKEERRAQRARPDAGAGGGDARAEAAAARTRRPLLAIALLLVLTLFAWLIFGRSSDNKSDSGLNRPNHVATYYAVPQDASADATMPDAIRHDVDETQAWLASQTDGHDLRVDTSDGDIAVKTKQLDVTSDDLKAGPDPVGSVANAFRSKSGALPNAILLVFVPVNRGVECGEGTAVGIAVIWVGSCGGLQPSTSGSWPSGTTTVIAHELLHALGAVPACAPHYDGEGHVDDTNDIMYREAVANGTVQLDPGHDDYYEANIANCPGIEDHPAWTTA